MQISSGKVQANGIELFYDERGPADGEVILFIMGLSAQMVFWPEPLLNALASKGYRVIRFDNRDVGLSTKFRHKAEHSAMQALVRYTFGLKVRAAYTLHDMVQDTLGLLDALSIEKAHLVGASMGGMIAQITSATHPQRVLSLTSIMSNTNSIWPLAIPKREALMSLIGPRRAIHTEDEYVAFGHEMMKKIGGTLPAGDALMESIFRQSWQRGLYPRGVQQQFMAIMATGSFKKRLKNVTAPTLVIHGAKDPLLPKAGGRATAKAIRGARYVEIPGMGHDLPEQVLPQIATLIEENVRRV